MTETSFFISLIVSQWIKFYSPQNISYQPRGHAQIQIKSGQIQNLLLDKHHPSLGVIDTANSYGIGNTSFMQGTDESIGLVSRQRQQKSS